MNEHKVKYYYNKIYIFYKKDRTGCHKLGWNGRGLEWSHSTINEMNGLKLRCVSLEYLFKECKNPSMDSSYAELALPFLKIEKLRFTRLGILIL